MYIHIYLHIYTHTHTHTHTQFKEEKEKLLQQKMLDTQELKEQVRVLTNELKASEEKALYDREQAQVN